MKLFITGGAGYVGAMLADQFSKRSDVEAMLLLDKDPLPSFIQKNPKISSILANTADDTWQEQVRVFAPDIVIHTAWQIRELFGNKTLQRVWNVIGSEKVFDVSFSCPSVKKLIYFSTASIYGAYRGNTIAHRFKETDTLRENEYLYGIEKKEVETALQEKYNTATQRGQILPQIFIIRPAAITGPRGKYMLTGRFGLQSALSGTLSGSFLYTVIKWLVRFFPGTTLWCRQFIHEDDITNIVAKLAFENVEGKYEIFNATPNGQVVRAKDMARVVGKKVVMLPPMAIRVAFFIVRNISFGKIPTSKGGWKFYAYPIVMDGSKLIHRLGYTCMHESLEAFEKNEGMYAQYRDISLTENTSTKEGGLL